MSAEKETHSCRPVDSGANTMDYVRRATWIHRRSDEMLRSDSRKCEWNALPSWETVEDRRPCSTWEWTTWKRTWQKISPPPPTPLVVQYDDVIWCQYRITGILDALPSSLLSIHSPTYYWLLHKTHIPFTFDPTRLRSRGGRSDRTTTSHGDDVTFFSFRFLLFCFIIARPRVGSTHFDMNAIFQH